VTIGDPAPTAATSRVARTTNATATPVVVLFLDDDNWRCFEHP
jgi:hypothetical protein